MPTTPRLIGLLSLLLILPNSLEAANKKQITVGTSYNFNNFDPRYSSSKANAAINPLIHCKLYDFDDNMNIVSELAEGLPIWKSDKSFLVKLKKNFKFNNGSPVTAEDVVNIYKTTISNSIYPRSSDLTNISKVSKTPEGVLFELKNSNDEIIYNLTIGIIPKQQLGSSPIKIEQVSTCGPYFVKQQTLNSLVLVKNSHNNFPNIKAKEIEFERTPLNEMVNKLKSGKIDLIIGDLDNQEIYDITLENPGLKAISNSSNSLIYLGFNLRNNFLSKVSNRKKIIKNIDLDSIQKVLFKDKLKKAEGLFLKGNSFYSSLKKPTFYRTTFSGKKKLTLKTTPETEQLLIAKAVAKDLSKAGLEVIVKPIEWGQFKKDIKHNSIEMWIQSISNIKSPNILQRLYSSSYYPPKGINRSFYKNKTVDKETLLMVSEHNLNMKLKKSAIIQNRIHEDLPYYYLFSKTRSYLARKDLHGLSVHPDGSLRSLREVYID